MDRDFLSLILVGLCIEHFILLFILLAFIPYVNKIHARLTRLMLAVQELRDRVEGLRDG